MRYVDGLATTLTSAAVPYGYTLVVWSTGSVVSARHRHPDVVDVALFAAGAAAAYGALRLVGRHGTASGPAGIGRYRIVRAGLVHVTAIALAMTAAALLSRVGGPAAWSAAPFASTFVYLGGTAVDEALKLEETPRAARA